MGNFLRLVGALAFIALVASFGLSAIYGATHEITEAYKQAEEARARIEALACDPGAVFVETVTDSLVGGRPFSYYTAYASEGSDDVLGYSFTAYGKGYSSTIVTIVGVDLAGTIRGVKITDQKETPGLGSKIQEVASQNTLWAVTQEVDEEFGTDYQARLKKWIIDAQERGITVAGALTDAKGNRKLKPSQQPDPFTIVRVESKMLLCRSPMMSVLTSGSSL